MMIQDSLLLLEQPNNRLTNRTQFLRNWSQKQSELERLWGRLVERRKVSSRVGEERRK